MVGKNRLGRKKAKGAGVLQYTMDLLTGLKECRVFGIDALSFG